MVEDRMRAPMMIGLPAEKRLSLVHKAWVQIRAEYCCVVMAVDPALRGQVS